MMETWLLASSLRCVQGLGPCGGRWGSVEVLGAGPAVLGSCSPSRDELVPVAAPSHFPWSFLGLEGRRLLPGWAGGAQGPALGSPGCSWHRLALCSRRLTRGWLLLQCESIAEEYEDELIEFLSHEADNVKDRLCSKRTGEPGWAVPGRGLSCYPGGAVAAPSVLGHRGAARPAQNTDIPQPRCLHCQPSARTLFPAGAACSFFWMLCPARRCLGPSQGSCSAGSIGCSGAGLLAQPMAGRPLPCVSLPAGLFPARKHRGQGTPRPLCFPINERGPRSLPAPQGRARAGPFWTWHRRQGKRSFPRGVPGVPRCCRLLPGLSLAPAADPLPSPCLVWVCRAAAGAGRGERPGGQLCPNSCVSH